MDGGIPLLVAFISLLTIASVLTSTAQLVSTFVLSKGLSTYSLSISKINMAAATLAVLCTLVFSNTIIGEMVIIYVVPLAFLLALTVLYKCHSL